MSYPYPPGQQPPYGAQPYGAQPYGGYRVADPGPPPPPVRAAWILELVLAAIAALSAALLPWQRSYVEAAMQDAVPRVPDGPDVPLGPREIAVVLGFVTALAVFFILIRVALWVWLAIMVRQGRNWARIVVTVIAGLGLAGIVVPIAVLLAGMPGAPAPLLRPAPVLYLPTILTGMVYVAVLVLLWQGEATRWFGAKTAWRRQQATRRGSPAGPAW